MSVTDYRCDEPSLNCNSHRDVNLIEISDVITHPPGVALAVLGKRRGGDFHNYVVKGNPNIISELVQG